jgi:uncharacterized repeat protein (TIGR01451 family)
MTMSHCSIRVRSFLRVAPRAGFCIWRLLLVSLAVLALSGTGVRAQPYEGDSQLWFDSSGTDQGAFGPNEIITVSGAMSHVTDCTRGINDTFFSTSANVYVLRHNTSFNKLTDVRGSPSVFTSIISGYSFFEQELATTQPQGVLASGDYDVVINECQDGFWNLTKDLRLGGFGDSPAFRVFIPADVADLAPNPEIAAMKAQAALQAKQLKNLVSELGVAFALIDGIYVSRGVRTPWLATKGYAFLGAGILVDIEGQFLTTLANQLFGYVRMAADPPDMNYQQLVTLAPITNTVATDPDPTLRAAVALANASRQEGALQAALLVSLEKYQGSQANSDGYWALDHAREIQEFSRLLGDQLPRTQQAISNYRSVLATNTAAFDQQVAQLQALQTRVGSSGFTSAEEKELLGLGLDSSGIAALQAQVLQHDYNLTSAEFLSDLDSLSSTEGAAIVAYTNLAAAMNSAISHLTGQGSLDRSQPIVVAGGPYTGQAGAPVTFNASGSSDPYGMSLSFAWDLNGNGVFDDATNAVAPTTFHGPFSGHIAVRVTNEEGKEAVGYAYLTVTDANQAPVFGTLSPATNSASIVSSNSLLFQATATDPDGDTVSIQWLLDGQVVATGTTFTYHPADADAGLHSVEARASDGHPDGVTTHDWVVWVTRNVSLADLALMQTDSPDPVVTGSNITYAVTVTNQGPDTASGVTLTDVLPAGATFVTVAASQGTASQNSGVVTALLGNLAAGASALVNITVSPTMSGTLSNSAAVTSSALDPNPNDNTSSELTRVNDPSTNVADLTISAPLGTTTIGYVGIGISYVLQVNNLGPDPATGVVLTETLAPGLVFGFSTPTPDSIIGNVLTFNLPPIPSGSSLQVGIGVAATNAGNFTSTTTVAANEPDPNPANNAFAQTTQVIVQPPLYSDLAITHTLAPNPVTISNQVTLTLTATNLGPSDSASATIVDALPAGLTFVSAVPAPNAVSGQLVSFSTGLIRNGGSVTVVIQALTVKVGTLANIASVTGANIDNNAENNQSQVELVVNAVPVAQSDLSVTLDSSTNKAYLGSNFTVTETVTNLGPDRATNTVLTTAIPTGLSVLTASSSSGTITTNGGILRASLGSLASGAGATVTFTGTPTLGRPLVIVATAASASNDPVPTNNIASVTVLGWNPSAAVAIAENFPDPEIDALQSYLLEMNLQSQVFNHQNGLTTNEFQGFSLIIYDDLSYAANGINDNDVDVFKAAYDAGSRLYFIGDDLAYSTIYALTEPEADTWVGLIHLNATGANYGGDGMMEIVDTNSPVTDGVFGLVTNSTYAADPDGTTVTGTGEILLGTSGTVDVLLSYEDPVTHNRTVTQGECAFDFNDPDGIVQKGILFKNAVTWLLGYSNVPPPLTPAADLSVTQTNTPASVSVADDVVYTISVVNSGPDAASGVMLTDNLPTNTTFVTTHLSQGAWSISNNVLTANLGSIVSNGTATLSLHLTAVPQGVLTNFVSVLGTEQDHNMNNNAAVSLLTVQPIGSPGSIAKADLSVSQTAPVSIGLGQLLTYSLTVTNAGPYSATNVTLNDALPAGASFVGALASQGTVAGASGSVNAALGVLASGASATLSIVANLAVVGANTNSMIVASDAIDPNPGDNASSWITTVTRLPATDLLVDARASQSSVPVGANVTFTFLVVNDGPDDSTGIQLTVPLPAGMSFVSASGGITPVSGTLNFALGPLAAGAIASANATLNGTVPGNVVSFASATSIEGGSNSASVTVSVFQPAPPLVDLAVTSSVNDTYVPPGGSLVYTIVVADNSPTVATGVVLTNKLPVSATFVSATSSSGTVTQTNGLVIANLGSVSSNAPVTLTINATPSQPDVLINRTTVTSAEADANPGDNVFYVLALSEVVITSVARVGADLRLTFETSLGKNYVVQTESDLTEGQWVDVPGSNSIGTGHILPVTISDAFTQPHQFYRVVLTP